MTGLTLSIAPIPMGWAVYRSSGQQLARFHGPWARSRAVGYIRRMGEVHLGSPT